MRRESGREDGFTLVEVLTALALVSLLATMMMLATTQFGLLVKLDKGLEEEMALSSVARHISGVLERAEPLQIPSQGAEVREMMRGLAQEVRFLAVTRRGAERHGLREVMFKLEPGPEGSSLVQLMTPRRLGAEVREPERIVLAERIVELTFRYRPSKIDGSNLAPWMNDWRNQPGLPAAVAIELTAISANGPMSTREIATPPAHTITETQQ